MLGRRAGLYWVGGRFYAGWEDGSMLGGSCPFPFFADQFLRGHISLRDMGRAVYAGLEWARTCVRALVLACGRAYLHAHAFFSACVRACVRFMLNCVSVCVCACVRKKSVTRIHSLLRAHVLFLSVCIRM